jgi:hypothetical protein
MVPPRGSPRSSPESRRPLDVILVISSLSVTTRPESLRESARERDRKRALLGTVHNGGSRASPAHGLTILMVL